VNLVNSLPESCSVIKRLLVPVARKERFGENLRDDLNADLQLTWDKPDCSVCETQGLMCGLADIYTNQVVCMSDNQEGKNILHLQYAILKGSLIITVRTQKLVIRKKLNKEDMMLT
jgi:hypothetical protein